jgi:hypothetical protein
MFAPPGLFAFPDLDAPVVRRPILVPEQKDTPLNKEGMHHYCG